MTHEERLKVVANLLKGDTKPPIEYYEQYVYNQMPAIATMNLYLWFQERGLA